jgi:hypothetical protein
MSGYIPKPNTGSLFPNSGKEEPQQPDLTGKINLTKELMKECMDATPDGELVVMDVSGWRNANDRIGLSVKKHYVKPTYQKAAEPKPAPAPEDDDSDIPF